MGAGGGEALAVAARWEVDAAARWSNAVGGGCGRLPEQHGAGGCGARQSSAGQVDPWMADIAGLQQNRI